MPLRQVQEDPLQGEDLRPLRRGGHQGQGAPGAHGPHRAGRPRQPHLVLQGHPLPDGPAAGYQPPDSGEGAVFRRLYRHRSRPRVHPPHQEPDPHRRGVQEAAGVLRGRFRGGHGRGGGEEAAVRPGSGGAVRLPARPDEGRQRPEEGQDRQAAGGGGRLPAVRQQAGVDDHRCAARHSPGAAPHGAAGRRTVRHLRSERPVPPGDQPEQPPEAAHPAQRAGHHRAQREADAPGGGGRPHRQRPPGPGRHRSQQPGPQVPVRPAQGQAGPVPPEPAGQAGGLLRPFRYRGGPRAEDLPVRRAQGDGY